MSGLNVKVYDGKYTVVADEDMKNFRALRYGEEWQDLCGNNLVYCLAFELQEARDEIRQLKEKTK